MTSYSARNRSRRPPPTADAPQKAFLKYDQVKVGGYVKSSLGGSLVWDDPWSGASDSAAVDDSYLSPALSGRLTITAKPVEEFGVNMDFRMSYPFSTTTTVGTASVTVPNISVWALYSKFSINDAVFMSFGKQPMAWGVSKGFFQPADDIFATSAVDYTDLTAEREGPLAFKAMIPIPKTMTNFYFYAGLPANGYTKPEELRVAAKAEINVGNTELAVAGYYCYNDFPRALVMATTGTGKFNFFGEAIAKYGSYVLTSASAADKISDKFFFDGTIGGYYTDSNENLTILAQVLYNGEDQSDVSSTAYYMYYLTSTANAAALHGIKYSPWYAGAMISKTELFTEDLSAVVYAVANISDLSGFVVPSVTYAFTDYTSVKLSASFTFGETGDEYIVLSQKPKPGASLSLTFTLGTGTF